MIFCYAENPCLHRSSTSPSSAIPTDTGSQQIPAVISIFSTGKTGNQPVFRTESHRGICQFYILHVKALYGIVGKLCGCQCVGGAVGSLLQRPATYYVQMMPVKVPGIGQQRLPQIFMRFAACPPACSIIAFCRFMTSTGLLLPYLHYPFHRHGLPWSCPTARSNQDLWSACQKPLSGQPVSGSVADSPFLQRYPLGSDSL